jgi:protein-disulfide isomerase
MSDSADGRPHRLRVPVGDEDWIRGPDSAPATLVEYFDYECPHCQAMYPMLEKLFVAYSDHMRFVVRHFPVVSSHPQAMDAALAAEAAGRQGKFWEMHERLFENPDKLEPDDLLAHARALRLDLKRFEDDMSDDTLRRRIEEQKRHGIRSGVNGTPTLFLNGQRYDGERTVEALGEAIEAAAHEAKSD